RSRRAVHRRAGRPRHGRRAGRGPPHHDRRPRRRVELGELRPTMNQTPALELRQVDVTVPDGADTLTILDGMDLVVAPGEIVMVTGASGSGKSTLLGVASLLRRPTSGAVLIDGIDTSQRSAKELARLRN